MKKKLCLILALLTLLPAAVASCSSGDTQKSENESPTAITSDAETTADPTRDANGYLLDSLPALDYGGYTVTMYVRGDSPLAEFYVTEQTGEIVDDAIYTRNLKVAERLNVGFAFVEEPGDNARRASFVKRIQSSIMANDQAYDIAAGYSMCVASLATAGMLNDLSDLPYLDFTNPWWSESLLSQARLKGKLFFASGDISTHMLYYMYATFFNKDVLSENMLEEPYQLVLDGKWTLDKLISMSQDIYVDLNGDGVRGVEDRYGFLAHPTYTDPFFFASGLRTTSIDDDGIPHIDESFSGEKTQKLLEKLCAFLHDSEDGYLLTYDDGYNLFINGGWLFMNNEVQHAIVMRDADFEFGLVPVPKYDEAQEEYYSIASFPYMLYGIPKDASDPDMSSAVMEALASESYRTVSPALYETALKVKYSSDDDASKMYDIIRGSMTYDIGRVFNDSLDSLTYSLFRNSLQNNSTNWASTFAKNEAKLEKLLAALTDNID